jgi:hypothetical protein
MNIGVNFSKIGSTGIILVFAVLMFAWLGVLLGMAPPVHAATCTAPSVSISPQSGSAGTTVQVSGSNITDTNCNPLTTGTATYGYSASTDSTCTSPTPIGAGLNITWPTAGSFTDSFTWPSGLAAGTYIVCASISGSSAGVISAGSFTVTGSTSATVSADQSSYTVGDTMTVSGTGFPTQASVTIQLQSSDGVTTTDLGSVTTDLNGSFTQDYTVPAHPLNSVVIIASYGSGQQVTSNSFTVKAKAAAKPKSTPTPVPTPVPPAPVVIVATPTPVPIPTDTPTAVPTDAPTAVATPTLAPTPVPTPVTASHTSSTPFNNNLVAGIVIGMGTLLGLGILFLVGRFVLRRYVSPAPSPIRASQTPPPWLNANADNSFAQTMAYPPANGPFASEPPTIQQPVPFNGPVPPSNGPFASEPPTIQQPVPFNGPVPVGNSGFAPVGVAQQPSPPHDWFASPN